MKNDTPNLKVSLTPYNAMAILSFLHEFIDEFPDSNEFMAIKEALKNYEDSVYRVITDEQIADAWAEMEVNDLIGKHPKLDINS